MVIYSGRHVYLVAKWVVHLAPCSSPLRRTRESTGWWSSEVSVAHYPLSQVNMVFDNLRETRHFNGSVLFLEEDHYVSPDFVVVAKKLEALREEYVCSKCWSMLVSLHVHMYMRDRAI